MSIAAPQKKPTQRAAIPVAPMDSNKSENHPRAHFKSFEDVYRTSYSHGLEAIYAIETVDLKTVRKIGERTSEIPPGDQKKISKPPFATCLIQLEFDFGDRYREKMDSFILKEPIQVLQLSSNAEKGLIDHGVVALHDLIQDDLTRFVYLKGMGQGHIDEVRQKLSAYIKDKILFQSPNIDFFSWVRNFIPYSRLKKMYVALEPFSLSHLCPLSPADTVEVRQLPFDDRQKWRQEIFSILLESQGTVYADVKKITETYIKPWVEGRLGFATRLEIMERIERIAQPLKNIDLPLSFFSKVFFQGRFPFSDFLVLGETDLYFCSKKSRQQFRAAVETAKTYFYSPQSMYSLTELATLVKRECALRWEGFPEGFVEKALRTSSCFRVRKGQDGQLSVRRTYL